MALVLGGLTFSAPLSAQDAPYLAEVPTAQQVAQGLAVASARETAARRYAALYSLENLLGSVAGVAPSTQVQGRMASFSSMRDKVYEAEKQRDPVNYLLERCSQAYSDSPAFQRELLDLYFSPEWQATYGARLDPRRWKKPLAMAPGAKVTAASMTPPMVEDCGSAPAPAATASRTTVAATSPGKDPVEQKRAEAEAILKAGDTVRAVNAYKGLVSAYPSRYEGYVGLGLIHVAQHQYGLALPAWQRVTELAPNDGFSLYMVGMSLSNLGRYEEARDVLRTVTRMKTTPDVLGWAHFGLGMTYVKLGQREGAIESYRALAVLDTALASKLAAKIDAKPAAAQGTTATVAAKSTERAAGTLTTEGNAYLKAGDTARALQAFKASVAKDPSEPLGYTGLGRIYTNQRQYALAVEAWQKAAALVPADWSVSFSLAVAYHGAKQYAEARDAYRKTLRLKVPPEYAPHVYEGLGAAYLALGQRDSAVAVYRALVPLDSARAGALAARINAAGKEAAGSPSAAPASTLSAAQKTQVETLRKEGKKYYDAKQYSKSRVSYEKLLRISPNDGWALYELGQSLLMIEGTGDNVDSMQVVWKRAVALNPTDTELLLSLGDALYTWDPEASYLALQRVLNLRPDAATQARAHSLMGWSYYFYLDSRNAAAEFKEAMRLDPGNDNYLYALGVTYAKAGQKDAAMTVHRQLASRNEKMAKELMETINKK